ELHAFIDVQSEQATGGMLRVAVDERLEQLEERKGPLELVACSRIRVDRKSLDNGKVIADVALDQSAGEIALVLEVMEEGAFGQRSRLEDVVERRAGEAALKHQRLGRRQDALSRLFALPGHGANPLKPNGLEASRIRAELQAEVAIQEQKS